MRICSLMPGATEIVAALGLADQLVGISHECDYPPEVCGKPVLLRSRVDPARSTSAEIDRQVRAASEAGEPLYELDEALLGELSPQLVLMQALCDVCGITPPTIYEVLQRLPARPEILALSAQTLEDVFQDIERIGAATQRAEAASRFVRDLRDCLAGVQARIPRAKPRVVCLEWLDPPYVAGHWVPEMIAWAGGQDVLGEAGTASRRVQWTDVAAAGPEIVVLAPCGFSVHRTVEETGSLATVPEWPGLPAVRDGRVFAVNATAYFSRPGPRLTTGVELLAEIFHPEIFRTGHIGREAARLALPLAG